MRWCARRTCGCCGASWKAARRSPRRLSAVKCGSWLACDGGGSVPEMSADTPLSQASQLPQYFVVFSLTWKSIKPPV
ncbi:hypothetical protein GDV60_00355 [Pseudomonas sp. DTU12.1]|nr:hypothetical protein GDV60_00355 [Pseudomonas sp. DTU12.1]